MLMVLSNMRGVPGSSLATFLIGVVDIGMSVAGVLVLDIFFSPDLKKNFIALLIIIAVFL